jgi:hypothetical protein
LILLSLISETGYTGIEDNYKIREGLNKLIFEIRRIQDLILKIKTKSLQSNAITKKLKKQDKQDA